MAKLFKTGQKVVLHGEDHATIYEVLSTNSFASELIFTRGEHKVPAGVHENSTLKTPSAVQIKNAEAVGQY